MTKVTETGSHDQPQKEPIVYFVPGEGNSNGELTLLDLWEIIWGGRYLIAAIGAVFAVLAVAYALLATEWYKADVLLIPNEDRSAQALTGNLGGLSGLAGLAGININSNDSAEALAVLKSRELAQAFIEKHGQEKFDKIMGGGGSSGGEPRYANDQNVGDSAESYYNPSK